LVRQVQMEAVIDVDSDLEQRQGVEVQVVAQGVLVADPLALEPRDAGDDVLDLFANLGAFHVDSSREVKLGWAILNLSGGVRAPPQNARKCSVFRGLALFPCRSFPFGSEPPPNVTDATNGG